jgi:hypothetical protein
VVLSVFPLLEPPLHAANTPAMSIIANNFFILILFYWLSLRETSILPEVLYFLRKNKRIGTPV